MEIIDQFNLPAEQTYLYIRDRLKWSMGIGFDMGRRFSNSGKMVVQAFSNNKTKEIYISAREASRKTGINQATISRCCRGKYKTAGGYRWRFLDPNDVYRHTGPKSL